MKRRQIVAKICYPDDSDKHVKAFIDLFRHYDETEGVAGSALVEISVEDNDFVIKVMKGFDCLFLPLKEVKNFLLKNGGEE